MELPVPLISTILPAEKKIHTAADTSEANELSTSSSSDAHSDSTVVDSDEQALWDETELDDDPEIGHFLYDALYNEHPAEIDVDLDALATA
jgi:hypothetical protein